MANEKLKLIEKNIDKTMKIWDALMKATLKLPFAKIDRETFLTKVLSRHLSQEKLEIAIRQKPTDVLSEEEIGRIAKRCIRWQAIRVTLLSFISAIPSGWMLWPALLFDLIQFQVQVFIIAQKLLFLYGCRDLEKRGNEMIEPAERLMIIMSTIMIGKQKLSRMLKSATGMLCKQAIERYAMKILSKMIIFNIMRQMAKWMGISFTKEMLTNGIKMLIPVVCAIISGLISYWLFMPMTKKLLRHLMEREETTEGETIS